MTQYTIAEIYHSILEQSHTINLQTLEAEAPYCRIRNGRYLSQERIKKAQKTIDYNQNIGVIHCLVSLSKLNIPAICDLIQHLEHIMDVVTLQSKTITSLLIDIYTMLKHKHSKDEIQNIIKNITTYKNTLEQQIDTIPPLTINHDDPIIHAFFTTTPALTSGLKVYDLLERLRTLKNAKPHYHNDELNAITQYHTMKPILDHINNLIVSLNKTSSTTP